jgi:hypothetical protein
LMLLHWKGHSGLGFRSCSCGAVASNCVGRQTGRQAGTLLVVLCMLALSRRTVCCCANVVFSVAVVILPLCELCGRSL